MLEGIGVMIKRMFVLKEQAHLREWSLIMGRGGGGYKTGGGGVYNEVVKGAQTVLR